MSGFIIWSTRSKYQHLQNLWSGTSQPLPLCSDIVWYTTQGVSKLWPLSAEDRDWDIKYFQALCLIEGPHGVILLEQMHDGPDFLLNMYFDWVESPNWHGPCGKKVWGFNLLTFLLSGRALVNIWDVSAHDGIKCEISGSQRSEPSAGSAKRHDSDATF